MIFFRSVYFLFVIWIPSKLISSRLFICFVSLHIDELIDRRFVSILIVMRSIDRRLQVHVYASAAFAFCFTSKSEKGPWTAMANSNLYPGIIHIFSDRISRRC